MKNIPICGGVRGRWAPAALLLGFIAAGVHRVMKRQSRAPSRVSNGRQREE